MNPITISEQLMFNTVKLISQNGSSGTVFFYNFRIDDKIVPTIITNKHVVNNNPDEIMTFNLHLKDIANEMNDNISITMRSKWIFHSTKDLCFCLINPILEKVKNDTGKEVFFIPIDDSILATNNILEELSALEEIVMVGYPIGLSDKKNNLPIFRKGYTSAHPAIDFNESGIGLVDIACFPGSSGSPIFILNESSFKDKKGNINIGQRIIFLGILYAGPTYNAEGDIIIKTIPTLQQKISSSTMMMTNLGYYIKSIEILEFKEIIKKIKQKLSQTIN